METPDMSGRKDNAQMYPELMILLWLLLYDDVKSRVSTVRIYKHMQIVAGLTAIYGSHCWHFSHTCQILLCIRHPEALSIFSFLYIGLAVEKNIFENYQWSRATVLIIRMPNDAVSMCHQQDASRTRSNGEPSTREAADHSSHPTSASARAASRPVRIPMPTPVSHSIRELRWLSDRELISWENIVIYQDISCV